MSKPPVIFVASANAHDAYLDCLKAELYGIRRELFELDDDGSIRFYNPSFDTTIKDIFDVLVRDYAQRVAIFHYSGHSNSQKLFTAGESADALGLANLFREQSNLKLLFLNGCSNKAQVEYFLQAGVKVVIGTSAPINDKMAAEFSVRFYQLLAKGDTIGKAFNTAIAELETRGYLPTQAAGYRFMTLPDEAEFNALPWGIYYKNEADLDWTLPRRASIYNIDRKPTPINSQLVMPLMRAIDILYKEKSASRPPESLPTNPRSIASNNKSEMEINAKHYISSNFPSPISESIATLFANEMSDYTTARLQQLVLVYMRLSKFISYVLLAQLWHERRRLGANALYLNTEFTHILKQFINNTQATYKEFNYAKLSHAIINVFHDNKITPFIPESAEMSDDYREAYNFMEALKRDFLHQSIDTSRVIELCEFAENHVATMLKESAYLVFYRLISMKEIRLYKTMYDATTKFEHQFILIKGGQWATDSHFIEGQYLDSYSVLLVDNIENKLFLNLAPLVMDGNSFDETSTTPKLLFLDYAKDVKIAPTFYYEHIERGSHLNALDKNKHDHVIFRDKAPEVEASPFDDPFADDPFGEVIAEEAELADIAPEELKMYPEVKRLVMYLTNDFAAYLS